MDLSLRRELGRIQDRARSIESSLVQLLRLTEPRLANASSTWPRFARQIELVSSQIRALERQLAQPQVRALLSKQIICPTSESKRPFDPGMVRTNAIDEVKSRQQELVAMFQERHGEAMKSVEELTAIMDAYNRQCHDLELDARDYMQDVLTGLTSFERKQQQQQQQQQQQWQEERRVVVAADAGGL
eukprot:TRINITY_DN65915_c9_g1_i1.p1 TRINITY_DN65915_c9_g1~~TRINITY_DN65915_c9_g1_i1.p1  ORF type:complete len:187 (+),score=79.85 TRINITY_DN65915_c9_g1_i1:71-631(+)